MPATINVMGATATVQYQKWSCDNPTVLEALNSLMDRWHEDSEFEYLPDRDNATAQYFARALGGSVVSLNPAPQKPEGFD